MKFKLKLIFLLILLAVSLLGCIEDNDTKYLKRVFSTKAYELKDGDSIDLKAALVKKQINGKYYRMYGYDGQIPGPTLIVDEDSRITVNFINKIDVNTTIHWHGVRVDNKYDGVADILQNPIAPGENFIYELKFPDPGIYWYHPHVREDMEQELGLYGNIIVNPKNKEYFNKVDKEFNLILDDILIDENEPKFRERHVNYALMGRYGNVLLVNGETDYELEVKKNELIRIYLTNAANAKPFNFSIENTKLKIIGSDLSKYEHEFFANSVVIAPGERYILEAKFSEARKYKMLNVNPYKTEEFGIIEVLNRKINTDYGIDFEILKDNDDIIQDIDKYRRDFEKEPDYKFKLTLKMPNMTMEHMEELDTIEWEDNIGEINKAHTNNMVEWIIKDMGTGKENMDVYYKVKLGDIKKIRIFNDATSMHPMQHPMHLHGQRFLVLNTDTVKNENLVWKDTVLISRGSYVDILVEFNNPGKWMIHCHIAEHLHSGMMSMFEVE